MPRQSACVYTRTLVSFAFLLQRFAFPKRRALPSCGPPVSRASNAKARRGPFPHECLEMCAGMLAASTMGCDISWCDSMACDTR